MKRYIINIMGPQAVGKSTVIEELKEYLPQFEVFGIDDFRRKENSPTPNGEMEAWYQLFRQANSKRHIVLESSGTSMNLAQVISGLNTLELEIISVLLTASTTTRLVRKEQREAKGYQNPPMYFIPTFESTNGYVLPATIIINTEKKQPFEVAAEIVEFLPGEFLG